MTVRAAAVALLITALLAAVPANAQTNAPAPGETGGTGAADATKAAGATVSPSEGTVSPSEGTVSPSEGTASPSEGTASPSEGTASPSEGSTLKIEVIENLLSVDVRKASFGEVIRAVAEKAGFKADIAESVFDKTLSARFKNVELERGITRLITLIKEKNYFIYYDSDGMISRIEIQGAGVSKSATPPRKTRAAPRKKKIRFIPPPVAPPPVETVPPVPPDPPPVPPLTEESGPATPDALDAPGAPYIPPTQEPVYIPPSPPKVP